ncbi:MAG TPA: lysylphosphatidylglycerol synthase domain-containing protein [Candidatus Eisenbacteria bacterium]|nr:lysylphosphatidylglycerol synthase domain-containing protein [Candidatus Eisenbacteria bacterium]
MTGPEGAAPYDERAAPRRPRTRALPGVLVVLLVGAFGWALAGRWGDVVTHLRQQDPAVLAGALVLCVVATTMSFLLWRGVLAALGSAVPVGTGARIFFLAQLGKYVPGSVWPVVAQMRMGREAGVPRQRMGLAFVLTLGLSVLWGLIVGLLAVPALLSGDGRRWWLVLLALPVAGVLLVPRALNAALDLALRLLRRPGLDQPLSGRAIAVASAWMIALWAVFGLHVWLLVVGLGGDPAAALPVSIGGFALAFAVGPLLVVLPAGAGVREAVLVVLLASVLRTAEATAVALTSRGLLMVTDGLLAAAGAVPWRSGRRRVS